MPINLMCVCGQQYQVREDCAGQQVRCTCGTVLTVPGAPVQVVQPVHVVPVYTRPPVEDVRPYDEPPRRRRPSGGGSGALVFVLIGLVVLLLIGAGVGVVLLLSGAGEGGNNGVADNKDKDAGARRDDPLPREGDPARDGNRPRDGDGPRPGPGEAAAKDELTLAPEAAPTTPPPAVWEKKHTAPIRSVAFSRDGRHALSASGAINQKDAEKPGGADNSVRLWDARTGKELKELNGFKDGLSAVAFSPGGRFAILASAGKWVNDPAGLKWVPGSDHSVHLWDVQEGRELIIRDKGAGADERQNSAARYRGHAADVYTLAFAPDGKAVLAGSYDGSLILWDFDGTQRQRYPGVRDSVFGMAFSPRGDRFATAHPAGKLARVTEVASGRELLKLVGHTDAVHCVAWSPDGKYLATGSGMQLQPGGWVVGTNDYTVRLWDAETGRHLGTFPGHTATVTSVAFTPDSRRLVSASFDTSVRLWDIESKKQVREYKGHTAPVRSVAVSPDGRHALTGGDDCVLRLWELPATARDLADLARRKDWLTLAKLAPELGNLGPEAREAIPPLLDMLKEGSADGRKTVLQILDRLGAPDRGQLDKLVALLDKMSPPEARQYAATALGKLGAGAATAVAPLAEALKDDDAEVRHRAARALGDLGPEAKPAAAALREVLTGADRELVALAAEALGKTDAKGPETGTALAKLLDHEAAPVRVEALKALAKLGSDGVGYDKLLKLVGDADANVSKAGADLLTKKQGPLAPADLDALRAALKGSNVRSLAAAVGVLAKAGAAAKDALPELIPLVKHSDDALRLAALRAVEAIDPDAPSAVEARLQALRDKDRKVRQQAAVVLAGAKGVEAKVIKEQVLPVLLQAMKPETADDLKEDAGWKEAMEALGKIGKPHLDALMDALDAYKDKGEDQTKMIARLRILVVIKGLGKVSNSSKYLSRLLDIQKKDPYPLVRKAADDARRAIQ